MAKKEWNLGDYVDVAERIEWFFEKYPEGSLQSTIVEMRDEYVVVQAFAYRSMTDERPGIGLAYEVRPGRTPYTLNSELMNAETSAWGRALAAIGAPMRGHVASATEVRGRWSERDNPWSPSEGAVDPSQADHTHVWEPVPNRALERCTCGATRKTPGSEG
jgi:hypothetical protein